MACGVLITQELAAVATGSPFQFVYIYIELTDICDLCQIIPVKFVQVRIT